MPRMPGTQYLVEALKAYEVSHLFYVPSILGGAMALAEKAGIRRVIVVNNNYSGGVGETSPFHRDVSFARLAEDMGCFGARVEQPDGIRPALERALASGKPAVVEVVSDTTVRAQRAWVRRDGSLAAVSLQGARETLP